MAEVRRLTNSNRVPIALQWLFPTPLAILMFFAPESPWWLVRKGRLEEAAKSVERLGRKTKTMTTESVAMMRRVIEMEKTAGEPSYLELFKGTDLRRTLIVSGVYLAQNLTGNLIANQAVYFFTRKCHTISIPPMHMLIIFHTEAGVGDDLAFALGLITSALQWIFVMLSWILTTYFGRRSIYLWGSAFNTLLLICLGIAGSVAVSDASNLAQAALGLIVSVFFCLGPAPASWVVIGETSAIRLRPLTTGFGRAMYYIVEFPCIYMASYMLNPQYGNRKSRLIRTPLLSRFADRFCSARQVRLRLGRHGSALSHHGVLPPAGDEEPLVPRDRHLVQAQGEGSQVEEDGH